MQPSPATPLESLTSYPFVWGILSELVGHFSRLSGLLPTLGAVCFEMVPRLVETVPVRRLLLMVKRAETRFGMWADWSFVVSAGYKPISKRQGSKMMVGYGYAFPGMVVLYLPNLHHPIRWTWSYGEMLLRHFAKE